MDISDWIEQNSSTRKYAHFDRRTNLKESWTYISDPFKISKHSFYPFIHYTLRFKKYNGKEIKIKEREICYSAHLDRCIYQYYGYLLNEKYNNFSEKFGFSDSAIAYRNNVRGKNNIHFAKQAFDFIKQQPCFIIVGDFTHFFDEIDHKYLKQKICTVLGDVNLPPDFYAIFKNITRYSKWDLKDILEINNLSENEEDRITLNSKETVLTKEQFKRGAKQFIKPNKNNFGIPQGSAISAVLSNVYMIEFDKSIRDFINQKNGLYLRYSDDFIIVLPNLNDQEFKMSLSQIHSIISSIPRLILQPDKTQLYYFSNNKLNCRSNDFIAETGQHRKSLDYLGFTFDGTNITIRDKTISKYYYRLYRKIKTIVKSNGISPKGNKISCNNLYLKYSQKGAGVGNGNFLTYVNRAAKVFGKDTDVWQISRVHFQKIRKKLKGIGL